MFVPMAGDSSLAACHGLPESPHAPILKVFLSDSVLAEHGKEPSSTEKYLRAGIFFGEELCNTNLIEVHLALELVDRLARNALALLPEFHDTGNGFQFDRQAASEEGEVHTAYRGPPAADMGTIALGQRP